MMFKHLAEFSALKEIDLQWYLSNRPVFLSNFEGDEEMIIILRCLTVAAFIDEIKRKAEKLLIDFWMLISQMSPRKSTRQNKDRFRIEKAQTFAQKIKASSRLFENVADIWIFPIALILGILVQMVKDRFHDQLIDKANRRVSASAKFAASTKSHITARTS